MQRGKNRDNSAACCQILLQFGLMVTMGFVIKAEKDWRDGRYQVAMQR